MPQAPVYGPAQPLAIAHSRWLVSFALHLLDSRWGSQLHHCRYKRNTCHPKPCHQVNDLAIHISLQLRTLPRRLAPVPTLTLSLSRVKVPHKMVARKTRIDTQRQPWLADRPVTASHWEVPMQTTAAPPLNDLLCLRLPHLHRRLLHNSEVAHSVHQTSMAQLVLLAVFLVVQYQLCPEFLHISILHTMPESHVRRTTLLPAVSQCVQAPSHRACNKSAWPAHHAHTTTLLPTLAAVSQPQCH